MCALRGIKPPTWVLFISQLETLHFTNDHLCPINHTTAYQVAEVKKKHILMRAEVKSTVTWTATSLNRRHSVSVWINVLLTVFLGILWEEHGLNVHHGCVGVWVRCKGDITVLTSLQANILSSRWLKLAIVLKGGWVRGWRKTSDFL